MDGTNFILWTTKEGGYFKATRGTREQYDEAVKTGNLALPTWDVKGTEYIKFFFIAYGTIEDNFDSGFGCSRDDSEGIARAEAA